MFYRVLLLSLFVFLAGCQSSPRRADRTAYSSPVMDVLIDVAIDTAVYAAERAVERRLKR